MSLAPNTKVVRTNDEAMSLLAEHRFGLVVVGVHFDESQMFTLLADIRAHAKYRKVPILCVLSSLGRTLKAMMANGFLNLLHFDDDEEGNARIRRIVDYMILIDGDLQHIARAMRDPAEDSLHSERRRSDGTDVTQRRLIRQASGASRQ